MKFKKTFALSGLLAFAYFLKKRRAVTTKVTVEAHVTELLTKLSQHHIDQIQYQGYGTTKIIADPEEIQGIIDMLLTTPFQEGGDVTTDHAILEQFDFYHEDTTVASITLPIFQPDKEFDCFVTFIY